MEYVAPVRVHVGSCSECLGCAALHVAGQFAGTWDLQKTKEVYPGGWFGCNILERVL
jgi:hypothetical protein